MLNLLWSSYFRLSPLALLLVLAVGCASPMVRPTSSRVGQPSVSQTSADQAPRATNPSASGEANLQNASFEETIESPAPPNDLIEDETNPHRQQPIAYASITQLPASDSMTQEHGNPLRPGVPTYDAVPNKFPELDSSRAVNQDDIAPGNPNDWPQQPHVQSNNPAVRLSGAVFNPRQKMASEAALELLAHNQKLNELLSQKQKEIFNYLTQVQDYQKQLEGLNELLKQKDAQINQLETENTRLQAKLRSVEREKADLQRETDKALDEIETNLNTILLNTMSELESQPKSGGNQ